MMNDTSEPAVCGSAGDAHPANEVKAVNALGSKLSTPAEEGHAGSLNKPTQRLEAIQMQLVYQALRYTVKVRRPMPPAQQ